VLTGVQICSKRVSSLLLLWPNNVFFVNIVLVVNKKKIERVKRKINILNDYVNLNLINLNRRNREKKNLQLKINKQL